MKFLAVILVIKKTYGLEYTVVYLYMLPVLRKVHQLQSEHCRLFLS
jgi:hypothetical protein